MEVHIGSLTINVNIESVEDVEKLKQILEIITKSDTPDPSGKPYTSKPISMDTGHLKEIIEKVGVPKTLYIDKRQVETDRNIESDKALDEAVKVPFEPWEKGDIEKNFEKFI